MSEYMSPIPSRIYNAAVGGHVAGADQIIDDETGITLDKVAGGALEEKEYTSGSDNGMGRVVLRKNLVGGVNTLTQAMMNKSNTIYVIQYYFTLGEDITIPANCVLEFEGGSISGNGTNKNTIVGNNTVINTIGDYESLIDVIKSGTFKTYGKIEQDDINRVLSSTRYRICGHRGYPNSPTRPSPDNSIVAIEEAAKYGFSGIETDPRKDKDGVIVLLHNDTVDSVSTSTGYIRDLSYNDVKYKGIYGEATDIHLTTLSEAVAVCKMYNMFILFDNKQVLTIDELIAFMEEHEYYNFGIFNYTETELATIPDKYIRIIEPKSSVTALEETLAKFSTKKNIWMRIYGLNDNIPAEVVNKCKEYGIKILFNGGMGTSTDKQYLVDAVDCFIVDNQLTEYGQKECTMLRSDAGLVATANNNNTYKEAIWSVRAPNKLAFGYHWSGCQATKFPDTKDIFTGGSYCLSFITGDRFANIHIDGSTLSNRIILEKFYGGVGENNRTEAEVVTNENAQEFANNLIVGKNIDCTTITKSGVYLIFLTEGCTNRPSQDDGILIVSYGLRNNSIPFVYKRFIDSYGRVFEAIQWGQTNSINWNQVVTCKSNRGGSTTNRPQSPLDYDCYFDTTLGKPIWWNGSAWVDATGATV